MTKIAKPSPDSGTRPPMQGLPPQSIDRQVKTAFQYPAMVQDSVQLCFGDDVADLFDFSRLSEASPEHVSRDGKSALSDSAWRVPLKDSDAAALFLFEFQWTVDPEMSMRTLRSHSLVFEKAPRQKGLIDGGPPLAIFSVVIYLGPRKWTVGRTLFDAGLSVRVHKRLDRLQNPGAFELVDVQAYRGPWLKVSGNFGAALLQLLQGRGVQDLRRKVRALRALARSRGEQALGDVLLEVAAVFMGALNREDLAVAIRSQFGGANISEGRTRDVGYLEEQIELVKDVETWFPKVLAGQHARVRRARKEGRMDGHKRLLVKQCRQRFGRDCANSLENLLGPVDSLSEVNRVSRWLLKSDSAEGFLARAGVR